MRSLDAILFDLGGTLDGREPWRARFHRLFFEAGVECSDEERVRAFDYANQQSKATPEMADAGLSELLRRDIGWQFESLGIEDPELADRIVERFAAEVAEAAAVNRRVLAQLVEAGIRVGVVTNGCGNAAILCEEYGFLPFLSVLVDSHRFGHAKPDPAIFLHALTALGTPPDRTGFVGDSLDYDIEPAKAIGMRTFWIGGRRERDYRGAADVILGSVTELPAHLFQHAVPSV